MNGAVEGFVGIDDARLDEDEQFFRLRRLGCGAEEVLDNGNLTQEDGIVFPGMVCSPAMLSLIWAIRRVTSLSELIKGTTSSFKTTSQ